MLMDDSRVVGLICRELWRQTCVGRWVEMVYRACPESWMVVRGGNNRR
jgi:hypothetical protein